MYVEVNHLREGSEFVDIIHINVFITVTFINATKKLDDALKENQTLQEIYLYSRKIRNKGAKSLMQKDDSFASACHCHDYNIPDVTELS